MALNPDAREKVWKVIRDANCKRCPLYEEANTVCLLGDGPVPSQLMLVGEAPGAREDDIQRPFSGVAGQYLDRIMGEAGLSRSDVYITNTVRCRPHDNRTPTKSEIKSCGYFMGQELEIVDPKYILLLGNTALQGVLGQTGVMSKRGTAVTRDGRTYFITIHPAAVLRNPSLESIFRADIQAYARLARGESRHPTTKSKLIHNSAGLAKLLLELAEVTTPIAFDVETYSTTKEGSGFEYWNPDSRISVLGLSWKPGESWVIALEQEVAPYDIPLKHVFSALNVALAGKKMIGHNAKFDASWLRARGVNVYVHFDTMIASHLLDENRPKGLKALARQFLGASAWEEGVEFRPIESFEELRQLAIYNGKDVDYTLRLYHIFKEELRKQPRLARLFLKLEMPALRAFIGIEGNGIPVDVERLEERHAEVLKKIEEFNQKLRSYVKSKELRAELAVFDKKRKSPFNSPVFLGKWLFGELKLPILAVGAKSNRPSTNESVLLQIKSMHPAAQLLMDLRKWEKYESTYTRNWLGRVARARKPRIFTTYNLAGTVTGRLSSDMQQVPRDLFIRSILGTPEGWKFIEADFSQVELRIAAMFSGDPELTKAFRTGGDPHRETAASVLGIPPEDVTKDQRKMAKAVNFGFLYGMGAKKFKVYAKEKYQVEVSLEKAQEYRAAFFRKYAALPRWHDRCRRIVSNLQQVQSPIGRIRHLPTIMSTDEMVVGEAERDSINSPVQGFASDLTVLSMVLLSNRLDGERAHIVGNVHDAVLLEARDDYAGEAAAIVKDTMEHLPVKALFGYKPTVPIEVEVTIGTHWGEK